MRLYRLAVGGVCVDSADMVLLRRPDDAEVYPSVWELPSGGVEEGEDPVTALRREMLEEAGLKVAVGPCVGYFFYISKKGVPCVQLNHVCRLDDCERSALRHGEEHVESKWVPLIDIVKYHITENVRGTIGNACRHMERHAPGLLFL